MELQVGGRHRRAMFTSTKNDEWRTPKAFFDGLDAEFHFTLDVAASETNHQCERYFTKEADALSQQWEGVCWCNPPYGPAIAKWTQKAVDECSRGVTTVMLVPARTDTIWFHGHVLPFASEIRFIRRRLIYMDNPRRSSPFPSMVVVFRPSIWVWLRMRVGKLINWRTEK